MLKALRRLDARNLDEMLPALATVLVTLVTVNLINGIAAGVLAFVLVEIVRGRTARVPIPIWAMLALFLPYYALTVHGA